MKLYQNLGSYIPAFFILQIDGLKDLSKVANTTDERTLAHELIHFLQDLSTTYGVCNIGHCVDVIKDQARIILQGPQPVQLPLHLDLFTSNVSM